MVLYAAPALKNVQELYERYLNKELIKSVNFQLASNLTGHHHNTYTSAGRNSMACSEPQQIKNFNFMEFLNDENNYETTFSSSNREFIITTAEKISNEFEKLKSDFIVERNEEFKISESFYIILRYCEYYGLE